MTSRHAQRMQNHCSLKVALVNFFLKGTKLMTALEETQQGLTELSNTIAAVDAKLDEVRTFIEGLLAGQGATPEQLQALLDMVNATKIHAAAVLAEADELDVPQG